MGSNNIYFKRNNFNNDTDISLENCQDIRRVGIEQHPTKMTQFQVDGTPSVYYPLEVRRHIYSHYAHGRESWIVPDKPASIALGQGGGGSGS